MNTKAQQSLSLARGMQDFLPQDKLHYVYVINQAKATAQKWNFKEIDLPVIEVIDTFKSNIGSETDIFQKEVYYVNSIIPSKQKLILRPEFTASLGRFFITHRNKLLLPWKFFLCGAVFRHDRPQKNRYRQFHQVNFEHFCEESILNDSEIIISAYEFLYSLSVTSFTLKVNYLGSYESRENFLRDFTVFLEEHQKDFVESKSKINKNPLRVLDTKNLQEKKILERAPRIYDYLSSQEKNIFHGILSILKEFGYKYEVDYQLVRGLDYYEKTVFEFIDENSQAILAGGRYILNNSLSGIGYAGGVERIMSYCPSPEGLSVKIFLHYFSEEYTKQVIDIKLLLQKDNYEVISMLGSNLRKNLDKARKNEGNFFIVVDDNIQNMQVNIKNLFTQKQNTVLINRLTEYIIKEQA